ncbi:MAG TPA: 5-deoxy-glucuronate isomerase [Alphaproteobacteria bacterium]|nr:5-deoxy-glucuronate isomerase [Alphaproteobacteria bacterium]
MDQLQVLLNRDNAPLSTLALYRLRMSLGGKSLASIDAHQHELLIYPLIGSVCVDGISIGGRTSVTRSPRGAMRVYAGGVGHYLTIECKTRTADILVAARDVLPDELSVDSGDAPQCLVIDTITPHTVGEGTHRRTVRVIDDPPAPFQIYGGETINIPGGWSSWPAHASKEDLQKWSDWQEVFFVVTPGYGTIHLDGIYHDGTCASGTQTVRNGDAIVTPLGCHPIVASPGDWLWYAWFYTGGALKKTYNQWATDLGTYVK